MSQNTSGSCSCPLPRWIHTNAAGDGAWKRFAVTKRSPGLQLVIWASDRRESLVFVCSSKDAVQQEADWTPMLSQGLCGKWKEANRKSVFIYYLPAVSDWRVCVCFQSVTWTVSSRRCISPSSCRPCPLTRAVTCLCVGSSTVSFCPAWPAFRPVVSPTGPSRRWETPHSSHSADHSLYIVDIEYYWSIRIKRSSFLVMSFFLSAFIHLSSITQCVNIAFCIY